MKYLIIEQRINKLIINWLNRDFDNLIKVEYPLAGLVEFYSKNDDKCPMIVLYTGSLIAYFHNQKIWDPLSKVFSRERREIQSILEGWFLKKYGIELMGSGPWVCQGFTR